MSELSKADQQKQIHYRDARFTDQYDDIWQSVGKCVFCDMRDKYIIFEENGIVLTISLFAYIDGHCMIVPRRHIRSVKDLTQVEWETVRKFIYIAKRLIKSIHHAKGMQIVQKDGIDAQSTVEHLHFHCIPFDKADLATWNYRKLKNTPLENAGLYKKARKKILTTGSKFEAKYAQPVKLPVICDALIINTDNEVLLEERTSEHQVANGHFTPPGGVMDDFSKSYEEEVAREVLEETGLAVQPSDFRLINSQIGKLDRVITSSHLKAKYLHHDQFVWNTFVVRHIKPNVKLKPGDDAAKLHWIPITEAINHNQTTEEIRILLKKVLYEQ
jgi:diadenosine tetraphosphate (Ap4A) HIT family hydrolase/ADP-ribose pyrophosphatase YjhB (NUDIX family)